MTDPDEIMPHRLFYVRWWHDGARRWYRSPHSFTTRKGAERYRDEQLGFPENAEIVASVQRWEVVA